MSTKPESPEPGLYAHPEINGEVYYLETITHGWAVEYRWYWMIAGQLGTAIPTEEMARIFPKLKKLEFRKEEETAPELAELRRKLTVERTEPPEAPGVPETPESDAPDEQATRGVCRHCGTTIMPNPGRSPEAWHHWLTRSKFCPSKSDFEPRTLAMPI